MIGKHPVLVGCAAGVPVWAAVTCFLFANRHFDSLAFRTLQALSWIPDRVSRWITVAVLGGPVEADAFVFLPVSFAYWVCVGATIGAGARCIMRRVKEPR